MLSILIPVYNYDLTSLVNDLQASASYAEVEFEILIGDDGSKQEFGDIFIELAKMDKVRLVQMEKNSGRSKIRNHLAKQAANEWILFIDADSEIPGKNFIKNYLSFTGNEITCVCGGRAYKSEVPAKPELYLHWKYGRNREVKAVKYRKKNPWSGFQSNNFLIRKSIFEDPMFNEKISGYGHEDTLFGIELKKRNIPILHINNPALHIGLEDSVQFIEKAREGVRNLLKVHQLQPEIATGHNRLLNCYLFLKKTGMRRVFAFLFRVLGSKIEKSLYFKPVNLYLFDFYRLSYMMSLP
jgi:glycosyltransferase involved in cell wall biosynthesis